MSSSSASGCSCPRPPRVDLTEFFRADGTRTTTTTSNATTSTTCMKNQQQLLLVDNLRSTGWSPLSITSIDTSGWKQDAIQHLFSSGTPKQASSSSHYAFEFRTAESGSATNTEPKESWEVRFHGACDASDTSNSNVFTHHYQRLCVEWMRLLRGIAQLVAAQFYDCPSDNEHNSLDLMRVFYYHPVGTGHSNSMGSSPHTDWGTFTCVWQDNVGGLQTYCRQCQVWNCVLDEFVVHMGDMTSLACRTNKEWWPSPLHQVVSPKDTPRLSMVYFAYPSRRNMTLRELKRAVRVDTSRTTSKNYTNDGENGCFHDEYSLLHNQSASGQQYFLSPREQFAAIQDMPIHQVISNKWQQVQR